MLPTTLTGLAAEVSALLTDRAETVAVCESSCGGLIAASLVAVPGASASFRGGAVVYSVDGARELLAGAPALAAGVRSASEPFAGWLATSMATKLGTDWAIGETGAAGPSGNGYGDPAGHCWLAVRTPSGEVPTRRLRTGATDRQGNMAAFAHEALALLRSAMS